MKALTGTWIEWGAALVCGVTTIFSFSNQQYGVAVIAGVCAGLVAGMQLGRWTYSRKN